MEIRGRCYTARFTSSASLRFGKDAFLRKCQTDVECGLAWLIHVEANVSRPHHKSNQPNIAEMILSGSRTGSPRLILSTFSMPDVTRPQTVYCRSRTRASSKQMKN
jgi:hypothetical protein